MKFLSKILANAGLITNYADFDTASTQVGAVGRMVWNNTDGTVDLGLKGGNVTLQVGQEIVARVVNKSGADLLEANYQVVKVSDAQGQRLAVDLAQADSDANSADTLGIVTETIINNQEGFITILGNVNEINTTGSLQGETWVDGDILYLSPTIAGEITNVKPAAPAHLVVVGYVIYAHAIHGKIYTKIQNGYELNELHDVLITTPLNNQVLGYDSATSLWKNASIATWLGYTPYNAASVSGTSGTVPLFGASNTLGNSILKQDSGNLIIDNGSRYVLLNTANAGTGFLALQAGLGSAAFGGSVVMYSNAHATKAGFVDISTSAVSGAKIRFTNNGLGGGNELMSIDYNGQIITANATDTGEHFIIGGSARVNGALTSTGFLTISKATGGNTTIFTNTTDADLQINLTSGVSLLSPTTGILAFGTSSTERARFSGANFLIGTTTDDGVNKLQVSGRVISNSSINSVGSSALFYIFQSGNTALKTYSKVEGVTIVSYQSDNGAPYTKTTDIVANADSGVASQMRLLTATSGGTPTTALLLSDTGAATFSSSVTAANFYSTGGSNFATSSGNVGIGTSSPVAKLSLSYSSATVDALNIVNTNTNGRSWYVGDGAGVSAGNFGFYDATGGVSRLVITSGGNMLIGTTTDAGYKLDINGVVRIKDTSSSNILELANTINSNYLFLNSGVGFEAQIRYYNPTAGDWYTGIRASAGIGSTSSYHIYSSTFGYDVFALNTNGSATFASSVTAASFIKSGGTSSQFLKADGSVDSSTYALASAISGTSGTVALFGASNTLGNSIITQSGGNRIDLDSSGSTVLRIASTNNTLFRGLVLAVGGDATEYASFKYHTNSGELRIMGSPTGFGGFTTFYNNNLEAFRISTTNQIITNSATNTGEHFIVGGTFRTNGVSRLGDTTYFGGSSNQGVITWGSSKFQFVSLGGNDISLFTNTTERVTIKDSSGNVLIGTTTDNGVDKLQVNGSARVSGAATFSSSVTIGGNFKLPDGYDLSWGGTYGGGYPTIAGADGTGLNFYPDGVTSGATLALASSGAATFSSSVMAVNLGLLGASPASDTAINLNGTTVAQRLAHIGATGADSYIQSAASSGVQLVVGSDAYSLMFRNDIGFNFGLGTASALKINSSGANFSSSVTATNGIFTGTGDILTLSKTSNNIPTIAFIGATANTYVYGGDDFIVATNLTDRLTITKAGAATFSSSVTSSEHIIRTGNNLTMVGGDIYIQEGGRGILSPNASRLLTIQNGALGVSGSITATSFEGTDNLNLIAQPINTNGTVVTINSKGTVGTISLQTNSIDRLTIATSGAATFSSSVTAVSLSLTTGNFNLGTSSNAGVVNMYNASTVPSASITNGVILYAQDVDPGTGASSELKVRDEAGNITTLSPHNFSLIPNGPSEELAWSYYSEKKGKKINVDMLKLARLVESLTDEQLVYIQ